MNDPDMKHETDNKPNHDAHLFVEQTLENQPVPSLH